MSFEKAEIGNETMQRNIKETTGVMENGKLNTYDKQRIE